MNSKRFASLLPTALLGLALTMPAQAQTGHANHGSHAGHGAAPAAADNASSREFKAANDRMHRDMETRFTGNADRDFLAGMIPHHQGAIDMAEVVLRHGKDARVRKLAEEIIRAQKAEIAQMEQWLKEMK